MNPRRLPSSVAWLGYGGLVPFIGLAIAVLFDLGRAPAWRQALVAYGAVILSFVGALHWAFAMTLPKLAPAQRTQLYAWSVVPALLGWVALLLPIEPAGGVLIAGLVAHYLRDHLLVRQDELPDWYAPLRLRLTVIASLCLTSLFATALG